MMTIKDEVRASTHAWLLLITEELSDRSKYHETGRTATTKGLHLFCTVLLPYKKVYFFIRWWKSNDLRSIKRGS